VNVFYVLIRTIENYEFDKIRIAGVTGNATNYKNSQGDNPIVQPEMKSRSPPSFTTSRHCVAVYFAR